MRRSPLDWQIGDLQTVARQSNMDWWHQKSSHCVGDVPLVVATGGGA